MWHDIITSPIFVLRTEVVTKALVSAILVSTSPISVLGAVLVTKPLMSGTFLLISILFPSWLC